MKFSQFKICCVKDIESKFGPRLGSKGFPALFILMQYFLDSTTQCMHNVLFQLKKKGLKNARTESHLYPPTKAIAVMQINTSCLIQRIIVIYGVNDWATF